MTHRGIGALLLGGLVSLSGTGAFLSPTMMPPSWATARYAHRARAAGRGVKGRTTSRDSSSPNQWRSTAAGSCHSRQRGLGRALEASLCGARYGGGTRHRQRSLGPLQSEAEDEEQQGLGLEEAEDGNKATKGSAYVDEGGETPSGIGKGHRRFWGKMNLFGAGKKMPNIKQLGLYAILSYGFVSNVSYVICVSMAWFATSKKTGLSPLAPGQKQTFLISYAAFFAINNVLRVPRFALSMSLAPAFDRLIAFLMRVTGRGKAFGTALCVFFVNILGTLIFLSSGILLASLLSGVPLWSGA